MARKKSAAKKAREAEEKAKTEQLSKLTPAELEELKQDEEIDKKVEKNVLEEFDSEEESETSEEEDDFGELITDDVEEGFSKVLSAIKNNDKTLFDPKVRFFSDEVGSVEAKDPKQKPIYLKDYHRMNLLSGEALKDDDEEEDLEKPKTYAEEREEERNELLSDIKKAFHDVEGDEDEDEEDDGFLKKKDPSKEAANKRVLPDPSQDEEKFLLEFANQQAWIPHQGDKIVDLDGNNEDDDEFEEAAEKFENAYNFRYEDANAAEIISYARTQATVRRNELNGRRKKREEERAEKEQKKKEKEKLISKKTNEKINKLADILEQVKKEYGADLNEDLVKKLTDSLLDRDFDDSKWDEVLGEVFNDDYYNDDSVKPTWDEDDEIMKELPHEEDEDEEEVNEASEEPPKKKSKKDQLKEKKSAKKEKKEIKELAEKVVKENTLKIIDSVEEELPKRGRSEERKETFKYREVSPESFGLTTREILIADDAELNEFIGLKKFAPYRPKEQRMKDKRKFAKSKHLKEWRKKVFKNEDGPEFDNENEIKVPLNRKSTVDASVKKAKKRKYNKD